jgi:osmotically-inducible protein OsmY
MENAFLFISEAPMGRDQEIVLKEIRAAFERETRINLHRYPIRLSFSADDLVLEGEAENIAAKKLALELAGAAVSNARIVDRLRVAPAERMGDAEIRDHVCKTLIQEPALNTCTIRARFTDEMEILRQSPVEPIGDIRVEVEDGVVILNGRVPSLSHKRLAGVLAWWVPSSRDVINGLEETPPEEDNDDEITDAVRLVLEKDPFVDAGRVRVSARNFVVTLEGLVPNEKVKEMAEFDAWYVFGVDKVVNQLVVER